MMFAARILLLATCLLAVGCSKTIEGTYETSNAKLGSLRFDANGKVTSFDAAGKKLFTLPYDKNDAIITINDPQHQQQFKELADHELETTGANGKKLIYQRR